MQQAWHQLGLARIDDGDLVISADNIINLNKKQDHQGPQLCFSR